MTHPRASHILTNARTLGLLCALLFGATILAPRAEADFQNGAVVMCGLYQGANCEVPIYFFGMCKLDPFHPETCADACKRKRPICKVQDFAPWVADYKAWGREPFQGELLRNADDFDEDGNLYFLAGKKLSVCYRSILHNNGNPIKVTSIDSCPTPKIASEESCKGGTHFNASTKRCEIRDPGCGSGGSSYATGVVRQTASFLAIQNSHFSRALTGREEQSAATASTDVAPEGLTETTRMPEVVATDGSLSGLAPSGAAFVSSGTSSSAAATAGGVVSGPVPSSPMLGEGASATDQVYGKPSANAAARTALASLRGLESYGGASVASPVGGGSFGAGSFGSSSATPGEGGAASAGSKGSEAYRTPAAAAASEDPADYFLRADISVSLFKRVTAQFRKKERELVLSK